MTPSSQDVELLLHRGTALWNCSAFLSFCLSSGLHICNLLQSDALSYRKGFEEWGQNLGLDIRWDHNAVASVSHSVPFKVALYTLRWPKIQCSRGDTSTAQEPWRTSLPAVLGSHDLCHPTQITAQVLAQLQSGWIPAQSS